MNKNWLPVIVNVVLLLAGVIVHLTPTDKDDLLLDKVKEVLPVLLAEQLSKDYA